MRRSIGLVIGLLGLTLAGCSDAPSSTTTTTITATGDAGPLGWLAGSGRPGSSTHQATIGGKPQLAGTIVIDAVTEGGPLATGGVQAGDVLLAVGDDPLPIKDDPSLDLLNALEQARSSGSTTATLTLLRKGATQTVEVPLPEDTLEDGLPLDVARFNRGAARALDTLDIEQIDDPITLAYCGLAHLAAGSSSDRVAPIAQRLRAQLGENPDAATLSTAVLFEAERIGALPDEVLVKIAEESAAPRMFAGGPGGPAIGGSFVVSDLSELPDDIREMVEKAMADPDGASGDGVQMMVMGGDDGEEMDPEALRESLNLPEGAEVNFSTTWMSSPPPGMTMPAGGPMMSPGGPAPRVALDPILQELDPERPPRLVELETKVARLVAAQHDDGSWGDGDSAFRDTTTALAALGSAQRVGLELPGEAVERGVTWLRDAVQEGKLAGAVARGADRRVEWVRAAHAVRALRLLNCTAEDDLLTRLEQFHATARADASPSGEDLLSHALLARAGGVATWQRFYDNARLRLVAAQDPDGRFAFGGDTDRDTALGALLLALQHERTPVLIGRAENPAAGAIDGYGKRPKPVELPNFEGGDMQTISGPGGIQAIRKRVAISPDGSVDVDIDVEGGPPE